MDKWHLEHTGSMKNYLTFAPEIDPSDLNKIHPALALMLSIISGHCSIRGINLHITSLIRSPKYDGILRSVSKTHQEGRALDFSISEKHGWTYKSIQDLITLVNEKCSSYGAVNTSGDPRPIVIHKNANRSGNHAHIQVRRNVLLPFM